MATCRVWIKSAAAVAQASSGAGPKARQDKQMRTSEDKEGRTTGKVAAGNSVYYVGRVAGESRCSEVTFARLAFGPAMEEGYTFKNTCDETSPYKELKHDVIKKSGRSRCGY